MTFKVSQKADETFLPAATVWVENLFEPHAFKRKGAAAAEGAAKYGCTVLMTRDHEDLLHLNATMLAALRESFPERFDAAGKEIVLEGRAPLGKPIANGNTKAQLGHGEYFKNHWVLQCSATVKFPPNLFLAKKQEDGSYDYVPFLGQNRSMAKEHFYDGVFCRVRVNFRTYDGFGGGVTCYVNDVLSYSPVGPEIVVRAAADGQKKWGDSTRASAHLGNVSSRSPLDADLPL
jgi:hypothetical protein